MKNLLALFIISAISFSTFGQTEMKAVGSKIYVGDRHITLADAKAMSITHSPKAHKLFSKAKKIRGWNLYRGITGASNVLGAEENLGFVSVVIGGAMIASTVPREIKRKKYIISGIESYNKAVGSKIDTGDLHITVADAEAVSFSTFGLAEMWTVGSKIYVGDRRITLADAKAMSITHSPKAHKLFSKAKIIRAWYLSGIIVAAPVVNDGVGIALFGLIFYPPAIAQGLAIMLLADGIMVAPSLLIEPLRKKYINSGIELYNKAIAE